MIRTATCAWSLALASALGSLNACRPTPAEPAALDSARWVLTPSAIASLGSAHQARGVAEEIRLGDPLGRSALYLKFPNTWRQHGRPTRAFLALAPSEGAASDAEPISVEVWRVRSDWAPAELRIWSDKPDLGPPFARAVVTVVPAHELRIDVTELVRFAASNPDRDFGLALLTRGGSSSGAAFSSGVAGGTAPRLEVYVSRARDLGANRSRPSR